MIFVNEQELSSSNNGDIIATLSYVEFIFMFIIYVNAFYMNSQ